LEAENPNPETGEIDRFASHFAARPQPVYRRSRTRCREAAIRIELD